MAKITKLPRGKDPPRGDGNQPGGVISEVQGADGQPDGGRNVVSGRAGGLLSLQGEQPEDIIAGVGGLSESQGAAGVGGGGPAAGGPAAGGPPEGPIAGPVGKTQPEEVAKPVDDTEGTGGLSELLVGADGGGGGPTVGVRPEGLLAVHAAQNGETPREEDKEPAQGSQPAVEGGQGGEGGDESQGRYQEFPVFSTIIPLCVLHQSIHHRKSPVEDFRKEDLTSNPGDDYNFPDFLNAPVNLRSELQQTKFNCSGNANLYKAYVENREPAHSPVSGSLTATVSSFNVVQNHDTVGDQVLLKSVNRKQYDLQLAPTILTVQHIQDALRWLEADRYHQHVVQSLQSGMAEYFQALQRININGNESQLEEFIRNHTWDGPSIWFPNILDELGRIEVGRKRRMLRRFIHENLAWMTKISLLLIDGLHRTATIDGATVGAVPAGASDYLVGKTAEFQELLTCQNDGTRDALALRLGRNTVSIDSLLTVGIKFPHDHLNATFCTSMMMLSGKMQHGQGQGENHSSKQIMHFINKTVRAEMAINFAPGFLLGNNNEKGLPLAWKAPLPDREMKGKKQLEGRF
jgi:hypothetical protein